MRDLPIIITGGGIAGLAAACALAKTGREIIVCERATKFETAGAGLQAGPNAVRALKKIGAWEAFAPSTCAPPAILIRDGLNGRILKRIDLGKSFEARFGEPYRVAHRAHLHGALEEVARSFGNVMIELGCDATGYENAGDTIAVSTQDRVFHASMLIGADGIRSNIRKAMLNDGPPTVHRQTIYRSLRPIPGDGDFACVELWLCPGAHLVHYPVDGGRLLNIGASVDGGGLHNAFAGCCSALQHVIAGTASWSEWPALDRDPTPRWHDGRALLIGDAAHPALPYLAQGAAMALEDAAALPGGHEGFEMFAAQRAARVAGVARASRGMAADYHAKGFRRAARNLAIQAMPETLFLARLGWIYRGP